MLSSHLSFGRSSGIFLSLSSKIVCIISVHVLHGFPISTKASRLSTPLGSKDSACSGVRKEGCVEDVWEIVGETVIAIAGSEKETEVCKGDKEKK